MKIQKNYHKVVFALFFALFIVTVNGFKSHAVVEGAVDTEIHCPDGNRYTCGTLKDDHGGTYVMMKGDGGTVISF